jgi:hypothetical protein
LLLGVVQTYGFGGIVYGFDGVDQPSRFSSFVSAQQYAAFLVAFLAITLWHRDFGTPARLILSIALGGALVLNGSRAWFFGALLVGFAYCWLRFRRVLGFIAFAAAGAILFAAFIVNLGMAGDLALDETGSRVVATLNAVLTGTDTSRNVGLRNLTFRLSIYQGVLNDFRTGHAREILLGHGTSSGGGAALRVFPNLYNVEQIDPNRTIHNEWLRALYEWGVLGLTMLVLVFSTFLAGLIKRYRTSDGRFGASVVLSFLPAFLAAMTSENILAGAGNAVTMSLAVVVAFLWLPAPTRIVGTHVA